MLLLFIVVVATGTIDKLPTKNITPNIVVIMVFLVVDI
jgi:hypothetical protein